ncbi:hypothetical protein DBR00_12235 [Pseudomonas sp. HMWF032]|uniref:hypothetical protein n=1 Tax=unclassified Pseudomonas TaxID=196821 RepID=UPI000D3D03D0|nr:MULTISPECIES: hypothetical protein [unclassified Pseudomonas]PTS84127.1 hypothetical protein DBR00_12235 [Pseudomonas sp. HMWF032]WAC43865.1 hypothetical protein OU997_16670 [Pseudomonas sp. SL4(2022)]
MRGLIHLSTFWRAALALLLLLGLLWLASNPHSQSPDGVLGLFVFSLFISLGFILFGQQRLDTAPATTSPEDQHLV